MDIPQHLEAEFNRIYDEDHVPTILKVPGVRSCARYRLGHSTISTMPRYLAIYEVDSAEIINSPTWQEASDLGESRCYVRCGSCTACSMTGFLGRRAFASRAETSWSR